MTKVLAALVCAFVLVACQAQPTDPPPDRSSGAEGAAKSIEGRLLAPCCWNQTLDVHESEAATALRAEIATRLANGEPASSIEDDLANRYGERIRVVPRGKDPRELMPLLVGAGMLLSALGLTLLLRSWLRRSRRAEVKPALQRPNAADEYDRRLDDELASMD